MTEQYSALLVVWGIGMLGGASRYLHDVGAHDQAFNMTKCLSHLVIGSFMAVMAGFVTTGYGLDGPWQHTLVGLAAMSSKELMTLLPGMLTRSIKANFKNIP